MYAFLSLQEWNTDKYFWVSLFNTQCMLLLLLWFIIELFDMEFRILYRTYCIKVGTTCWSAVNRCLCRIVHSMVVDNRLSRAPWPHPIFDNSHAHSICVQKAEWLISSKRKKIGNFLICFHWFYFIFRI